MALTAAPHIPEHMWDCKHHNPPHAIHQTIYVCGFKIYATADAGQFQEVFTLIPSNLTTQQTIILASLPSGILTATAAQNALPHLSGQSVRAAIKKLIDQHYLVSCSCTVKDRKSEKHKISYYKLTGKAVSDFFPSLFLQSDLALEYLNLYPLGPGKTGPLTPYVRDSYTINRLCRIIECEQFCSAAGVRTLIDPRDIDLPAVFGRSEKSPVCRTQLIGLDLNEAACELYREGVFFPGSGSKYNPASDFCFYRSVEISRLANPSKDPATILSPAVGILSSCNRALAVYCTPRHGGMSWIERSEKNFAKGAELFARHTKGATFGYDFRVNEAILFYRNDRELLNFLQGKRLGSALDYKVLGRPYQRLYAIPFTRDGLNILRQLLLDPDFAHKEIIRAAAPVGPSATVYSNLDSITPLCILGHDTFCALPLNITMLATVLDAAAKGSELPWFLGYPMYSNMLRKLFPKGSVTETLMPSQG